MSPLVKLEFHANGAGARNAGAKSRCLRFRSASARLMFGNLRGLLLRNLRDLLLSFMARVRELAICLR